jgi:hypothetical protein
LTNESINIALESLNLSKQGVEISKNQTEIQATESEASKLLNEISSYEDYTARCYIENISTRLLSKLSLAKINVFQNITKSKTILNEMIENDFGINMIFLKPGCMPLSNLQPLLDLKIKILTKDVNPGANLNFEVSLLNMGETQKVEDITVNYSIRQIENQLNIIAASNETLTIGNFSTITRTLEIPKDTPEGIYIIEVNASYWHGSKYASSADNFDVTTLPWPLLSLKALLMNWVIYIILLIGVTILVIIFKLYYYLRIKNIKK